MAKAKDAETVEEINNLPVVSVLPEITKIEGLDGEALARVNNLYQMMTSSPDGIEQDVSWRPDNLKIKHNVGNDPLAPHDIENGDLYVPGQVVWSAINDGRGKPFKFVICYAYTSRARFPKGETRPDCTSADSVWNDFGTMKCQDCPSLPFRNGKRTDCNNSLNVVLLPLDLSGVYIVRFSKTSYRAGSNMLKILKGKQQSWDQVFGLTSRENTTSSYTYFTFQTAAISNDVPPEVKLFAEFISKEYAQSREAYLASLKEARENAAAGLDALEGLGEIADGDDSDDGGFEDTM